MDILSFAKYMFIITNFIIIFVLYKDKKKILTKQKIENEKKKIVIITAHPDDESMFFIPTINNLKQLGYKISLLCFSNGNSKIREKELTIASQYLKFDEVTLLDLQHKNIIDGMNNKWNSEILYQEIEKYIKQKNMSGIITFDNYGVSGHINHRYIFKALDEFKEKFKDLKMFKLTSVNIFRKYLIILDIIIIIIMDILQIIKQYFNPDNNKEKYIYYNLNPLINYHAMSLHQSQFVWYRKLFVFFSRYTFINQLEKFNQIIMQKNIRKFFMMRNQNDLMSNVNHKTVKFVTNKGYEIITSPFTNKICAFNKIERRQLSITGLVPPVELTIEQQKQIYLKEIKEGLLNMALQDPDPQTTNSGVTPDMIRKWKVLQNIQNNDETLFYYILTQNIASMAPVIYTPTVGWVCKNFSKLLAKPRGMYLSYDLRGELMSVVQNWPYNDVDAIVMTDGSRILGLGDLGVGGLGISIGKLDLYVAAAGFHPRKVLPIVIDVGTDNKQLQQDPLYLGLKHKRIDGKDYQEFIDEVVAALSKKFPHALLQFEDFQNKHALTLLNRYRDEFLVFNDDVQGTAAISLAGVIGALKLQGIDLQNLSKMKICCVGAGSAGLGVCRFILDYMIQQGGISEEEAYGNFYIIDSEGLITRKRDKIQMDKLPFSRPEIDNEGQDLQYVIEKFKPQILIGLSGQGGIFTPQILKLMKDQPEGIRPIIFPLSNPTSKSEASIEDILKHTDYQAIVASGSPFENVQNNDITYRANQANNAYIFPGLALGATIAKAKIISDEMLLTSSEALVECLTHEDLQENGIFPKFENIREVSLHICCKVILMAIYQGLCQDNEVIKLSRQSFKDFKKAMKERQWDPAYRPLVYNEDGR